MRRALSLATSFALSALAAGCATPSKTAHLSAREGTECLGLELRAEASDGTPIPPSAFKTDGGKSRSVEFWFFDGGDKDRRYNLTVTAPGAKAASYTLESGGQWAITTVYKMKDGSLRFFDYGRQPKPEEIEQTVCPVEAPKPPPPPTEAELAERARQAARLALSDDEALREMAGTYAMTSRCRLGNMGSPRVVLRYVNERELTLSGIGRKDWRLKELVPAGPKGWRATFLGRRNFFEAIYGGPNVYEVKDVYVNAYDEELSFGISLDQTTATQLSSVDVRSRLDCQLTGKKVR